MCTPGNTSCPVYSQTAQFSFHRNPKYHVDADKFVPERFLTGKGAQNPAFAPFGDGGRSCVGLRFAKAEAKVLRVRRSSPCIRFALHCLDPLAAGS